MFLHQLIEVLDHSFNYNFAIIILMLLFRLSISLQFNTQIGPLIKIVGKMVTDFQNFFILYVLLTLMFAILGNINFVENISQYSTLFDSVLLVIDASLGQFDFGIFQQIKNDNLLKTLGEVYFIILTTCFNMIMIFFIIAILATTYKLFEASSNGLVLTKILQIRDEMSYDISYGCFLTHFPPFNFLLFLAIPFGLILR